MPNFISEDDIERAMVQRLAQAYGYETLNGYTADPADLNDRSGRSDKRDVILHDRLKKAAMALNPGIPESAIDDALKQLCDQRQTLSAIAANREVDALIRDGVRVEFKDGQGRNRKERIKLIDFVDPASPHNQFLAVTQLWIESTGVAAKAAYRRPDILLYINGLPLVFIELKNSNVKLRSTYDDNLINYKADIPQLFLTNAFCVFSNGIETRVGSLTASWEHFFHWLRPEDEKEKIRREQIRAAGTSAERFLAGLCPRDKLLDYLENFVIYHKVTQKIIAQNHQFIGVNRGFDKFLSREKFGGKLGVFWHTQGSGKSFSMIFYARKIFRKCEGNYSFVVITDREDLDGQIYRNFLNTETVRKADAAQPNDSEQMRAFLGQNKRIVFTLIQKFRWPRGQAYPLLSDRDDIIVIVDEAHRTQYKSLDKFTAVKMYDKVQRLWLEEIKSLRGKIRSSADELQIQRWKRMIEYMRKVDMAVVVSAENGEEEKFDRQKLDIRLHRKRMDQIDQNGHDVEHKFKDPDNPLQLVFVCAMWLTGFDAPTVSTLYLDKPQKDHTLMQTIARANRVSSHRIRGVEKKIGEVVDYYGVLGRLKKAIKDYGQGDEGSDDLPIRDKDDLFRLLDEAITQAAAFCVQREVDINNALDADDVFTKVNLFGGWADTLLSRDEWRKTFNVYENTITALFEASKPEILGRSAAIQPMQTLPNCLTLHGR